MNMELFEVEKLTAFEIKKKHQRGPQSQKFVKKILENSNKKERVDDHGSQGF